MREPNNVNSNNAIESEENPNEKYSGSQRAVELNRRILNRRRELATVGFNSHPILQHAASLSVLDRIELKEKKAKQFQLFNDVVDEGTRLRLVTEQCAKNFKINKDLRRIDNNVTATTKRVRAKQNVLDGLATKLKQLTTELALDEPRDEKDLFITTKVDRELALTKETTSLLHSCKVCGREMSPTLLAKHEPLCKGVSLSYRGVNSRNNCNNKLDFMHCHICDMLIKKNAFNDHVKLCDEKSTVLKLKKDGLLLSKEHLILPEPPYDFQLIESKTTFSELCFTWESPIFTGSVPVYDFEINYSIRTIKIAGPDIIQLAPPMRTSRWCLRNPVPQNEFKLTGLNAGQIYTNISIKACTSNGVSNPSNVIVEAKTLDAVSPSSPMFFNHGVVTATSIHLRWSEPIQTGGVDILEYEVRYIGQVPSDSDSFDMDRTTEKTYKINTGSKKTYLDLENLRSSTEFSNFVIFAINTAGFISPPSKSIASISTKAPGRESKMMEELHVALNSNSTTIDSDFYNGFKQRYNRKHYIKIIANSIKKAEPHLSEKVDELVPNLSSEEDDDTSSSDDSSSDDETTSSSDQSSENETSENNIASKNTEKDKVPENSFENDLIRRRRQFNFRISELQEDIQTAEYNIQWCKDRRADLVILLTHADEKIFEKQSELERASVFLGSQMDSRAVHGRLQRFYTNDLIFALEEEIAIDNYYISDTKKELIEVDKLLSNDLKILEKKKKQLESREKSKTEFEAYAIKAERGRDYLQRLQHGCVSRCFETWQEFIDIRKANRRIVDRVFTRVEHAELNKGFLKWKNILLSNDWKGQKETDQDSIGSRLLANAVDDRALLEADCSSLLITLRQAQETLDGTRKTIEETSLQNRNIFQREASDRLNNEKEFSKSKILEGKSRMAVSDFSGAIKCFRDSYETLQQTPVSNSDSTNVVRDRFKKEGYILNLLGEAFFGIKDYDRSILNYNRSIFCSEKSCDRITEASSNLGIGKCKLELKMNRQAIFFLRRAITAFEDISDMRGKHDCCRKLSTAHSLLEETDEANTWANEGDRIEYVFKHKIKAIGSTLDSYRFRLAGVTARPSADLVLERVSTIVPKIRNERIQYKIEIIENEKSLASLSALLVKKKQVIEDAETDLKKALASHVSYVDSSAFLGVQIRYTIDDFKKKIGKFIGIVKAAEERIEKDKEIAAIRIGNLKDQINELEIELEAETGNLMRQVLSKRHLRCFHFSETNLILKSINGRASGSVGTCVGSSDNNIIIFDLETGVCMANLPGVAEEDYIFSYKDPPPGHTKTITCIWYNDNRLYSGSMDFSLIIWKEICTNEWEIIKTIDEDFDAPITCICTSFKYLICGCSDCQFFLFSNTTYEKMYQIASAHSRTVSCIDISGSELVTGSSDGEMRVWHIRGKQGENPIDEKDIRIVQTHRLRPDWTGKEWKNGHVAALSCVKVSGSEIVSSDRSGMIIIWDMHSGEPLKICRVHNCPITCLQFDSTRIVSGGKDGVIYVTDIATGRPLQRFIAHKGQILALQFDRGRMVSAGEDGFLKYWVWQSRNGKDATGKTYHNLGPGETLRSLSLRYRVSIENLKKWNKIVDVVKLYIGQRLVVQTESVIAENEGAEGNDKICRKFGKLELENIEFLTSAKARSKDRATQIAEKKEQNMAKEYFPDIEDSEEETNEQDSSSSDSDNSDSEDQDNSPSEGGEDFIEKDKKEDD